MERTSLHALVTVSMTWVNHVQKLIPNRYYSHDRTCIQNKQVPFYIITQICFIKIAPFGNAFKFFCNSLISNGVFFQLFLVSKHVFAIKNNISKVTPSPVF